MHFEITTPEKVVYKAEIEKLTVPTELGQITILPHHIPLVASIAPGELIITDQGKSRPYFVSGGFVEVRRGGKIVILADAAEHVEEIDVSRAEEARDRAKKLMQEKRSDALEYAEAAAALERSLARLHVARHRHHGRGFTSGTIEQ